MIGSIVLIIAFIIIAMNFKTKYQEVYNMSKVDQEKYLNNSSYSLLIWKYTQLYNLSYKMIKAMMYIESRFNPNAMGPSPDVGLMQITKSATDDLDIPFDITKLKDPEYNIHIACKFIREKIYNRYNAKNYIDVVRIYNAGIGKFEKGIIPDITKEYIIAFKFLMNLQGENI